MPYRRQNRNKSRTVNRKGASTRISGLNPRKSTYLTDSPFAKKGLTLRKLMRGTPNLMRENSRIVDILQLKRTQTRSGMPAVHARMRTRLPKKIIRETYIIGIQKDKNGNIPDKPINKHSKVLVSCTCLTGDTKVLTDKGWQTIYELAEPLTLGYYPIKYNVKGEFYNGSHPFYKGKEKVWKLKLSNGQEITATKDHKFLKHNSHGNYKYTEDWTELKNLKVGDKLISNEFHSEAVERNEDFWNGFFMGVLMGDGTVFSSGEPNLKLFGDKKTLVNPLIKLDIVKNVTDVKNRDAVNVAFKPRATEICHKLKYDNKKSVKLSNKNEFLGYFSGLVATDGSVYKNGDIAIDGGKEYLEQLSLELIKYGYTRLTFFLKRKAGIETCVIDKNTDYVARSTKEMWSLKVSGLSNIINEIPLTKRHRQRYSGRKEKTIKRKAWTEIKDISYAGKQHVYDITVPKVNCFVANGILAHNCENFLFYWEWANTYHGASRIIYGNGQPPKVTNPQFAYGLCKHLYRLGMEMIENDL